MKFNTPLPQPLPKECQKAAQIFKSFVDSSNNGLDGVIPRSVLENAKGFAIFTIFKAGFLFSARAGSGIVIAKLDDGSWSAPSAIGTAGVGVGGQAGAEMTDFLIVLNSRSAVTSFMSAGSLTLGGNLSLAVGPLGRNGEAIGSLNTSGKVAAMYSYSKTRGLFGGVSIEGSVIVERQDANAQAYRADVTAKQLLSGAIPPPDWASPLIKTLETCTGMPGGRRWVQDFRSHRADDPYMFGSVESPGLEHGPAGSRYSLDSPSVESPPIGGSANGKLSKKKKDKAGSLSFPPMQWGRQKSSGSYFSEFHDPARAPEPADTHIATPKLSPEDRPSPRLDRVLNPATGYFETRFQSDYISDDQLRQHPPLSSRRTNSDVPDLLTLGQPASAGVGARKSVGDSWEPDSPFNDLPGGGFSEARSNMSDATSHRRAFSAYAPSVTSQSLNGTRKKGSNPFEAYAAHEEDHFDDDLLGGGAGSRSAVYGMSPKPKIAPKAELTRPLLPHEGVARAIALYDFKAVQPGDLSFSKGQVIIVTEKSDDTNTWWKGKLEGREGVFPANFVEVV
ncbi:hypothetical protein DICSQDRAFT_82430 [Dichomitus squalens LYAD-421 SS1]|uniref:uncharacterized protein n=1 Tax=Dichomitus squalens (strain LYAD-421) TaxID=732165 RepID=UPI0004413B5D|nr:uncharacterized protein DICSQDRAFT_82430 [Dichomitus squalens LYAD-421 SS1]EJF63900.1 hypothetical protein DICSQDRAFT_82430 [Dichomitus squalens LYAD-421 SS1]